MVRKSVLDKDTDPLIYCRKCQEKKKQGEFYQATDKFLDSNGYMSICKNCCNDIYNYYYNISHSVDSAILQTCRILNVIYIQSSVESVKTSIENKIEDGKDLNNIFGLYKRMLSPHARGVNTTGEEDLTFVEPNSIVKINVDDSNFSVGSERELENLKQFWGENLPVDDYEYLERELADWKKTHKCDTKSEELLLKEICWKQLEIKRSREDSKNGKGSASLIKDLQELLKTAALTPTQANAASSGKLADSLGVWIKDIEEKTPAEWWQDQEKFKDMDGIQEDRDSILESIKKFILGNAREYAVDTSLDENSDDGESNV
jgi:hypothetical protein